MLNLQQDFIQNAIINQGYTRPDVMLIQTSTTSTNDDLLQLCQQQPHITSALVCSETQTQGRGQHQRQWHSPQGNIYLSVLATLQHPLDGKLALEVALSIIHCPSLQDYPLQIKWANDLYSPQGKWGGILIEPIDLHRVIVGIGINLQPLSEQQRSQITQACTSLSELNIVIQANPFIAELYIAIQNAVQWFNYGSQNLKQRFNHVAYQLNEMIEFEYQQQILKGRFLGINDDGALILHHQHGEQCFYNGRMLIQQ